MQDYKHILPSLSVVVKDECANYMWRAINLNWSVSTSYFFISYFNIVPYLIAVKLSLKCLFVLLLPLFSVLRAKPLLARSCIDHSWWTTANNWLNSFFFSVIDFSLLNTIPSVQYWQQLYLTLPLWFEFHIQYIIFILSLYIISFLL